MNELPFSKMHGLGNCFILMDDRNGEVTGRVQPSRLAHSICDRDFGIGADGLILVGDSTRADLAMRIFNEDGSEPEMCGNGVRCFARFVVEEGITSSRKLTVETLAGVICTEMDDDARVTVDMGEPILESADVSVSGPLPITLDTEGREFTFVSMGNPHAVSFVDDFDFDWRDLGKRIETDPRFPNRVNVEFVKQLGPNEAEVKVWERGCGETKACGTGACAVTVAGALRGAFPRSPVTITLPGGDLTIEWSTTGRVLMTGPATNVARGVYFERE